jgi:hypothetical protein
MLMGLGANPTPTYDTTGQFPLYNDCNGNLIYVWQSIPGVGFEAIVIDPTGAVGTYELASLPPAGPVSFVPTAAQNAAASSFETNGLINPTFSWQTMPDCGGAVTAQPSTGSSPTVVVQTQPVTTSPTSVTAQPIDTSGITATVTPLVAPVASTDWFSQQIISGVPNWALAAAAALLFLVVRK